MKPIRGSGIEITLGRGRYRPLRVSPTNPSLMWDNVYQGPLHDETRQFSPESEGTRPFPQAVVTGFNPPTKVTFVALNRETMEEMLGTSRSIRFGRAPQREVQKLQDLIERLHKLSECPEIPAERRDFFRNLRLPDPVKMPECWRIRGWFRKQLFILWGVERVDGGVEGTFLPASAVSSTWRDSDSRQTVVSRLGRFGLRPFVAGIASSVAHVLSPRKRLAEQNVDLTWRRGREAVSNLAPPHERETTASTVNRNPIHAGAVGGGASGCFPRILGWLAGFLLLLMLFCLLRGCLSGCSSASPFVEPSHESQAVAKGASDIGHTPGTTSSGVTEDVGTLEKGTEFMPRVGETDVSLTPTPGCGDVPSLDVVTNAVDSVEREPQRPPEGSGKNGTVSVGGIPPPCDRKCEGQGRGPDKDTPPCGQTGVPEVVVSKPSESEPPLSKEANGQSLGPRSSRGEEERPVVFEVVARTITESVDTADVEFSLKPLGDLAGREYAVVYWTLDEIRKDSSPMKVFRPEGGLSFSRKHVIGAHATIAGRTCKVIPYQWNNVDVPVWQIVRDGQEGNAYKFRVVCANSSSVDFSADQWIGRYRRPGQGVGDDCPEIQKRDTKSAIVSCSTKGFLSYYLELGTQVHAVIRGKPFVTNRVDLFEFMHGDSAEALLKIKYGSALDKIFHCLARNQDGSLHNGTAFAVSDKYLLTNYHVAVGSIEEQYEGRSFDVRGVLKLSNALRPSFHARVVKFDRDRDVALIRMCSEGGGETEEHLDRFFQLADAALLKSIQAGEECSARSVMAIGYPRGTVCNGPPAFTDGKAELVERVRVGDKGQVVVENVGHYTNIEPGYSGGPLIDMETGRVLGVNRAGLVPVKAGHKPMKIATSANEVRAVFGDLLN